MTGSLKWVCKDFNQLTIDELYGMLQLRSEIFVVEQKCAYQDLDGFDKKSFHLLALHNEQIAGYTRLLPPMLTYNEQSIGRVALKKSMRGAGVGKLLMQQSILKSYELFGRNDIKIGAQYYLKHFYGSLGFVQCSEIYDEHGIEHIKMIKPITNNSELMIK